LNLVTSDVKLRFVIFLKLTEFNVAPLHSSLASVVVEEPFINGIYCQFEGKFTSDHDVALTPT
jgi:hypothetical protein